MLSQHSVGVLKDHGIAMVLRLEERDRDDRGYRVPEKEVLIMSISLGV